MVTGQPKTNAEFLAAIFGPPQADARPWLATFPGDPKHAPPDAWAGFAWLPGMPADGTSLNWYFTLGTYRPDAGGRIARVRAQCVQVHGVMLDDVGTKADAAGLAALPPSVLIETSPGNHQALYLFDKPVADIAAAGALQTSLIAAGLCDPDAHGPATRYCRLPFAVNGKTDPPHACRLVEWRPAARYSIAQIRAALQLPEPAARTRAALAAPALQDLSEADRVRLRAELESALSCIPMDSRDEWIATGQALASLGDMGRELWTVASRKSAKYEPGDEDRFDGFKGERADYRAVLTRAAGYGWVNPRHDPRAVFGPASPPLPPGASLVPVAPPGSAMPRPPFVEVPIDDLARAAPDPQVWWVDAYLPAGHVTLLGGHGGAGKSTLALMLGASIAAGLPFLGAPTRRGRVLFFSAEDPGSLVRRRLSKVCREFALDPAALAPMLRVLDVTEAAPALFTEQRQAGTRTGVLTATYAALAQYVSANAIDVAIIDNASDTYDADEINRASVRQFVQSLARLVRARNGAVLLLAHVDKSTSRAGASANLESYSGSTAWHNSVRSRLFFRESNAPGTYELQHQKSNLGPRRPALFLVWPPDGLPRVSEATTAARTPDDDLRGVLATVAAAAARDEFPTTAANGRPTIAAMVRALPAGDPLRSLGAARIAQITDEAETRGYLVREEYESSRGKFKERFAISGAGSLFIGLAPSAPSAPST